MSAATAHKPIVHFVGSIPLPDAETVFRTLAASAAPHLKRLPDGETGIRKTWIRFLQDVLADNPAIEVAQRCPAVQVRPVGRQADPRDPAPARQAGRRSPTRRASRPAMPTWRSQSWSTLRPPAAGGRDPGRRQVPDQPADPDRADLQQHGAGRPAGAAAGADAALHRRGRGDRRGRCPTTASRCNGTCARRCLPGRAITSRGRSISAPRRSPC